MRKTRFVLVALAFFACLETILAIDYTVFAATGGSAIQATWGSNGPRHITGDSFQTILWQNSYPLAVSSWVVFGVTYFRHGISRKWRKLGFDQDMFNLMVTMKGAKSRLAILSCLNQPRHKTELSALTGLDWREVDRQVRTLHRFGLIALYAQSGAVRIYKLNERGKLLQRLVMDIKPPALNGIAMDSVPKIKTEAPSI